MLLMLESGMRGGVSYIAQRYCKAEENEKVLYIDGEFFTIHIF